MRYRLRAWPSFYFDMSVNGMWWTVRHVDGMRYAVDILS
jgi:hypothetical protein